MEYRNKYLYVANRWMIELLFVQFSQQADRKFIESCKVYQYNQYKQNYYMSDSLVRLVN